MEAFIILLPKAVESVSMIKCMTVILKMSYYTVFFQEVYSKKSDNINSTGFVKRFKNFERYVPYFESFLSGIIVLDTFH